MQKIVINVCHGGFGLSDKAMELYKILTGIPPATDLYYWDIDRDSPQLVQIVEQLGERANNRYSTLKVVEVPRQIFALLPASAFGNELIVTVPRNVSVHPCDVVAINDTV